MPAATNLGRDSRSAIRVNKEHSAADCVEGVDVASGKAHRRERRTRSLVRRWTLGTRARRSDCQSHYRGYEPNSGPNRFSGGKVRRGLKE